MIVGARQGSLSITEIADLLGCSYSLQFHLVSVVCCVCGIHKIITLSVPVLQFLPEIMLRKGSQGFTIQISVQLSTPGWKGRIRTHNMSKLLSR